MNWAEILLYTMTGVVCIVGLFFSIASILDKMIDQDKENGKETNS